MLKTLAAVAAVAAALLTTGTASAAEVPPGCPRAKQIGTTGYVKYQGKTIASVKQFAGCGKNWPYTWVWDSYASGRNYRVSNWIAEIKGNEEIPHGGAQGVRNKQEVWGTPANTINSCTRAVTSVTTTGDNYVSGWTDLRC